MAWKRRQFPFGVVPLPKGCSRGPTDFAGGIPDDHLALQRDCDPFSRMRIQILLAIALIQIIVPSENAGDELLKLRRIVRDPRFDEPPVFAPNLLSCHPLLLLLDAHLALPP